MMITWCCRHCCVRVRIMIDIGTNYQHWRAQGHWSENGTAPELSFFFGTKWQLVSLCCIYHYCVGHFSSLNWFACVCVCVFGWRYIGQAQKARERKRERKKIKNSSRIDLHQKKKNELSFAFVQVGEFRLLLVWCAVLYSIVVVVILNNTVAQKSRTQQQQPTNQLITIIINIVMVLYRAFCVTLCSCYRDFFYVFVFVMVTVSAYIRVCVCVCVCVHKKCVLLTNE